MNILQRIARSLAHGIGILRLHLSAKWVSPLTGFLLIIVLVGAADYFFATTPLQPFAELNKGWKHKFGDWLNIWMILAIYALAWLHIWSVQARSRMVVEKFTNYAGPDFQDMVNGASMMLLVKLGQLHDLYQVVDEQRAIPTVALSQSIPLERSTAVDAAISVDNIEAFLKDAVTSQSTLDVGPVHIPIGILLSLLGRASQGPHIVGSFHKDVNQHGENLLILTAQATKDGKPFTWRVERTIIPGKQISANITDIIDEFACRIFTDMTLRSTVRWRAADRFAQGLRAYRDCLRTPKNRISNLQLAEEKFIETLTEDTQYTLAHYNLGVVLTELQRKEAATAAFERAIHEDPRSSQAYYALALNCYLDEQFYRTCQICRRVIELKPDLSSLAKACQLQAMALLELNPNSGEICYAAINACKKAMKYACKALRRAEITQQDDGSGNSNSRILQAETLLGVCISSLAKIYLPELLNSERALSLIDLPKFLVSDRRVLNEAKRLLRAALKLHSANTTYDALYHWELGRIYCAKRNYEEAAQHLRIAVRTAPDHIEYLADLIFNQIYLSITLPSRLDRKYDEYLFQWFLDLTPTRTSTTKKETVEAALQTVLDAYKYGKKDYERYLIRFEMIRAFLLLGYRVGTYIATDELARMTDYELTESYKNCKLLYERCIIQCYCGSGKCQEACYLAANSKSAIVSAETSTSVLISVLEQQVIDTIPATNKILCLPLVVLAYGRIQLRLSRKERNGTASLANMLKLLEGLDAQAQNLLYDLDTQEQNLLGDPDKLSGCEWELGQIFSILARLYDETGRRGQEMGEAPDKLFRRAEYYYREAIRLLKKNYPRGISVQNLHSSLASVLLQLEDQQQKALKVALESITLDAMNYKNYETLGDVYFACEDFRNAIETWEQAMSRKNTTVEEVNDPDLYVKFGSAYAALVQSSYGVCLNGQQYQEAVHCLEYAMKFCADEDVPQRLKVYGSLGYLYYTRGDYDQAIEMLLKAIRLEASPEIYLHLAQACQYKWTHLSDGFEKQQLLANIRVYCQHARDLNGDDDKSLSMQLDDLVKSLP